MQHILITGGTGLVGSHLSKMLKEEGFKVSLLSRTAGIKNGIKAYYWNIKNQAIDAESIAQADVIVHLAGAGIADKRWTKSRKQAIINSRTQSTQLLINTLKNTSNSVKTFIGASAIGYYGNQTGYQALAEDTPSPNNDFLSQSTTLWEQSYQPIIDNPSIRFVGTRIGIVLSTKGGALPKTDLPVKLGAATYFGNGKMIYSWIHITDLCRAIIHAIKNNDLNGFYNAVAPNPVSNKDFVEGIAKALDKFTIPIPTPEFALRFALGEMADVVLSNSNVSSSKIMNTGFIFKHPKLVPALEHLYANGI